MTIEEMDLEDDVAAKAEQLLDAAPTVVFTSGRRTIEGQAAAMAHNEALAPGYVAHTYAQSDAKAAILQWLDDNPDSSEEDMAAGFADVLNGLPPEQQVHISRHLTGRAFDVRPNSCSTDDIDALEPSLFLTHEGGLNRWHVEFD